MKDSLTMYMHLKCTPENISNLNDAVKILARARDCLCPACRMQVGDELDTARQLIVELATEVVNGTTVTE